MDRIETEKSYPQNVKVVNELKAKIETSIDSPLIATLVPSLLSGTGRSINVFDTNTGYNQVYTRPQVNNYNLCVGSCVASNQGASIVVPLNLVFYNITPANESTLLADIESKLPLLFPSGTTIRYTYSDMDSSGLIKFYVEDV